MHRLTDTTVQRGHREKDHCRNMSSHICTGVVQHNDLMRQNSACISKPLTLNQPPRCLNYPFRVFFPLGKIKEAANEYNLISLQAGFPSSETHAWTSAMCWRNGSGSMPKCFPQQSILAYCCSPLPVSVPVCMCQSLVSYRDRIKKRRGQIKSEVTIITH